MINLSGDKDKVIGEAFRVLKPGGRFAVSDIVLRKPLPEKIRRDLLAWAGCVAGALLEQEYRNKLTAAGFADIEIQVTREYDLADQSFIGENTAGGPVCGRGGRTKRFDGQHFYLGKQTSEILRDCI